MSRLPNVEPQIHPLYFNPSWPKWKRQCEYVRWRRNVQCKAWATPGSLFCGNHGGFARIGRKRAYKNYLFSLLLPHMAEPDGPFNYRSPVLEEEIKLFTTILCEYALGPDAKLTARQKWTVVEYLLHAQMIKDHKDPASLLTHLTREQAEIACDILTRNELIVKRSLYNDGFFDNVIVPQAKRKRAAAEKAAQEAAAQEAAEKASLEGPLLRRR